MICVSQSVTGARGNCMSACLASLLEIENVDDVPLFLSEPGDVTRFDWAKRLDAWLAQFGLYALHFYGHANQVRPGVPHIATGISPRGRPHAVIGQGNEILWDPHPSRSGLVFRDGFILLTFTGRR
jgi:hypothetical protein